MRITFYASGNVQEFFVGKKLAIPFAGTANLYLLTGFSSKVTISVFIRGIDKWLM
jgi:hypothetical protein